jgi:hypothetical protein
VEIKVHAAQGMHVDVTGAIDLGQATHPEGSSICYISEHFVRLGHCVIRPREFVRFFIA